MNIAKLAVIVLLAQAPASPTNPATVEGAVILPGTREAVPGARVQLFRSHPQGPPNAVASGSRTDQPPDLDDMTAYSAVTSADGRFLFENVKPGEYRLVAFRSGFVPGEFGQRSPTGLGISFELSAGQRMQGAQLVVTPTGSISGRVFDRDGPAGKLQVQALRPVYRDGQRVLTIVQSVQTDDRGEYRLFWLPPASYYVTAKPFNDRGFGPAAGPDTLVTSAVRISEPTRVGTFEQASSPVVTSRTTGSGEVFEEVQLPVYYPGTTELSGAARIDLRAGAHADGMDIAITTGAVRARHIRGVALANGQPAAAASIILIPRTGDPSLMVPSARTTADGSFDVSGVVPGFYFAFARTNPGLNGGLAVQIGDADVDNLVIPITSGARLTGRFVIDGRSRTGAEPDVASLRATLRRDPEVLGMPDAGPTFSPPPAQDGSFELQGVSSGDFRVSVRALPPDAYIKSMHLGAADVLDSGLHLSGPTRETLEIVIGANAGTLSGTVVNARQEPLSNVTVALVPGAADRHRIDLYKSTTTGATGTFRVRGIAAGNYTVLAWEQVDDGAWQDPDFMRAYDNQGKAVSIRDGLDENIRLTAIPPR